MTDFALTIADSASIVQPSPANTGYTGTLTQIGSLTINDAWIAANGNVLENFFIDDGSIKIDTISSDIIIRNFLISGGPDMDGTLLTNQAPNQSWGINIHDDLPRTGNVLIEDGEFIYQKGAAITASDLESVGSGTRLTTIRRCHIREQGADGVKLKRNAAMENCYIQRIGKNLEAHGDGNQTQQPTALYNVRISDCFFDLPSPEHPTGPGAPYKVNACALQQANGGSLTDFTLERSWVDGGAYAVWFTSPSSNPAVYNNCIVRDNLFYLTARNGAINGESGVTATNNRWAVSGFATSVEANVTAGDLVPGSSA